MKIPRDLVRLTNGVFDGLAYFSKNSGLRLTWLQAIIIKVPKKAWLRMLDETRLWLADTERLTANDLMFYHHYSVVETNDIFLPCVPSLPDVNVTLQLTSENTSEHEDRITYSPLYGYRITRANSSTDAGFDFECSFVKGNRTTKGSFFLDILRKFSWI